MQAANAEISWEFLPNLEAALFADAGSLSQSTSPFPDFPDDLRYAIGLGLRYALPVGPLRLDYGLNPDRRDGEPSGAFHATFGYAF
jgi:outer membrane translocation and assembly module TamA